MSRDSELLNTALLLAEELNLELGRKERLIQRLLAVSKQRGKDLRKANKRIKELQTEKKGLRQRVAGAQGGIKSMRQTLQQRRTALENIAYLHENKNANLAKAEKEALAGLNWKKHKNDD